MKQFKIVGNDLSDGYHTFDELYDHRCLLYLTLAKSQGFLGWAWRPDYEGWFCLYWTTPFGQISYHIPNKYIRFVEGKCTRDDAIKFDGHTSNDVLWRLASILECEGVQ